MKNGFCAWGISRIARAFTLLEILCTLAILTLVIIGTYGILNIGNTVYYENTGLLELQQEARQAMEGMIREIRQGIPEQITISGDNNSEIDFYLPGISNVISYSLSNNQIVREHPGDTYRILANNINALSFCCVGGTSCSDCDEVSLLQISIRATKTVKNRELEFSLVEKVRLRNKQSQEEGDGSEE